MNRPMAPVAGVDACRGGWVAIVVDESGFVDSRLAPTFREILDRTPGAAEIGVDIPIGLPAEGARAADIAAREFVGPRRNSVFPTPTRAALAAATYAEARSVFPSLSAQSYALGKKILEVGLSLDERLFEVHPEVSFAALAGRHLQHPKRSWNGLIERLRLLSAEGIELPDVLAGGGQARMTCSTQPSRPGQHRERRAARHRRFPTILQFRTVGPSPSGTKRASSSLRVHTTMWKVIP
jgi:hypothetical protein